MAQNKHSLVNAPQGTMDARASLVVFVDDWAFSEAAEEGRVSDTSTDEHGKHLSRDGHSGGSRQIGQTA